MFVIGRDIDKMCKQACIILSNLSRKLNINNAVNRNDLDFYSWPETLGSTSGLNGIGGQILTQQQVYAFQDNNITGHTVLFCGGSVRIVKEFTPFKL